MYGWGRGFSAGFAPARNTPTTAAPYTPEWYAELNALATAYGSTPGTYAGRAEGNVIRTGDPADKLGLPIGHEFTAIGNDPIPDAPLVLLGQPVVKQAVPVIPPLPAVVPVILPAPGGLFDSIPWWGWLAGIGGGLYLWKGRK
jgi:hypothetical protein